MENITRRQFFALAAAALIAAATPTEARAADPRELWPVDMQDDPITEQNGVTYLLHEGFSIVIETPDRRAVTIPDSIRHDGKRYDVTAIWDETFSTTPKLRRVILKAAKLETIEDPAIFDGKIEVICSDRETYEWLKDVGVKAKYRKPVK